MNTLKNLFENEIPSLYASESYQNEYGIAITNGERPHIEQKKQIES